ITFFLLLHPPSHISPLFPYTTLFRSKHADSARALLRGGAAEALRSKRVVRAVLLRPVRTFECAEALRGWGRACRAPWNEPAGARSEEHTSELQSRENLVCRLLLEKKN